MGIENNTALAKNDFYYKASLEDNGVLPNAATLNARVELRLDDYYEFNEHFASQKPSNYVGKRMKLISVEGDYIDYDYDAEKAVVTVYLGDIPLGGKCELDIICEVLPMPGVSESTLKLTPRYYTDNIAMASPYLTPTICVGVPPKGNPYIQQYDDCGLGEGYAHYSFKVID